MKTMKRKKINLYGWAVSITTALLLSSCINDVELADSGSVNSDKTLSITINQTGSQTRTTNISADPGSTENTINRVTIGVFDSEGTTLRTLKEISGLSGTIYDASITAHDITTTDQVLVAVNAPSGTFAGVTNVTDFKAETMGLITALTGSDSGTSESASTLPMFGTNSAAITISGSACTASVTVKHLVAKVSLTSLTVNFDATGGYKAAKFTPTEIFLTNVPDKLKFSDSPYSSGTTFYQGESTNTTNLAAYLGTGTLSATSLSGSSSSSWGTLYFYTMPNSTSTPTRLVIKGNFDSDGDDTSDTGSVYYPVTINSGTVEPNKNYQLTVVIKSKGSDSAGTTIDQQTATVNITVSDFTGSSSTTTFE